MKKFIFTLIAAIAFTMPSLAQNLNNRADDIVGEYLTDRGGSKSKVRVTKKRRWYLYGTDFLGRESSRQERKQT